MYSRLSCYVACSQLIHESRVSRLCYYMSCNQEGKEWTEEMKGTQL